ncbi:hypothetical protein [Caulobacter mirabilis]|uniref:Uncharacterized protein n=1 Tax=Caulobacter mirabilis TaxID=69666 RepID=A0A2D2B2C3_9CAUL|nr:hypothetical protein [Caulobacter mirabilis]ATQ44415.1 hypothetical protein CSW64_19505 [Caulobacter mirabilis]
MGGREHRFRWRGLNECRGEWVRLEVSGRVGGWRQGWARGVCNAQETSCDGAVGDSLPSDRRPF